MDKNSEESIQRKQKRLGPAPIASFEVSFDDSTNNEVRSKMDSGNVPENRLPDIRESETPIKVKLSAIVNSNPTNMSTGPSNLGIFTPSTPRIDISRASSSSHHDDSRDSSPENVFEQVGTGTLQEVTKTGLGFHEDGTMDLRSSTEELYFLEGGKEKPVESSDKFTQQVSRSPIMFKFDEQQTCLQQNQRKDSASSEVAALLCISGRTSRISSVGSQGSAVSRLSAMSGISRSPSPHKMLVETSFCGPKPLDNIVSGGLVSSSDPPTVEILEQVLLARKQDPTQAVLAEGVHIDTSTPKKAINNFKPVGNGNVVDRTINTEKLTKLSPTITATRIPGKGGVLKAPVKPIVGKTSSGVEYFRIKLKPDHLYSDKGLGEHERILEDSTDLVKKPATLSLGKDTPSKKAAPHFSQLVKTDDAITMHPEQVPPSASPKATRHKTLRDSRSPSPATVTVSRKSSFCSLFKSKEVTASPLESPTINNQRKKSGISLLNDSPRDRSRSKSRESDGGTSQNSTPSKQKSILAIFKPKRSGSKSKSASPVDPEAMSALDGDECKLKNDPAVSTESGAKSRLRYYDPPLDGKSIHIPLHTPPDEKENNICTVNVIKERREQNNAAKQPQQTPKELTKKPILPTEKVYRIENADGSIWIPLRSPTDDNHIPDEDSMWSVEANRNSSLESEETVISSRPPSTCTEATYSNQRKLSKTSLKDNETLPSNGVAPIPTSSIASISSPVPVPIVTPATIQTQTTTTAATTVSAPTTVYTTKEKRRILFCTKIGSGSQEQMFATQLSLSKTESLCSQLSEQTLQSPIEAKERSAEIEIEKHSSEGSAQVTMRKKDLVDHGIKQIDMNNDFVEKFDKSNRHSKYIDNIDEIMTVQKQLEEERKETIRREIQQELSEADAKENSTIRKPDPILQIPGPPKDRHSTSAEERFGSSESELDSELTTKQHLRNPVGSVEEESAKLVEQESFEDELPYVPTTLPEERPVGIAIIPIKERSLMDVSTCRKIERPRSTTPLNPCHLEEYCGFMPQAEEHDSGIVGEKIRISLPRKDSKDRSSAKSPRRISNVSGKSWFEFAEQGIGGTGTDRRNSNPDEDPPPLPPRKPQNVSQWINFENIPERRKQPKRITTLPNKDTYDSQHHIQYNYVNPEECQCECHEIERDGGSKGSVNKKNDEPEPEDTLPLLEGDASDCANRTSASDCSLESPHEHQSEHVSRSRTRDTDEPLNGESSSNHRRDFHCSSDSYTGNTSSKRTNFRKY